MTLDDLKALSAIKARNFCTQSDDRAFLKEVLDNDPRAAVQAGVLSRLRALAKAEPAPKAEKAPKAKPVKEKPVKVAKEKPAKEKPAPKEKPAKAAKAPKAAPVAPPVLTEEETVEAKERSQTAKCPRCGRIADTEDEVEEHFGYRMLPSKKHGKIQVRQSRCKKCRGGKTCDGPRAAARRAAAVAAAPAPAE